MTGLASKWATDETLVEEARKQDVRAHKKTAVQPNSAPPDKKITKLPSIWADAEIEPVKAKETKQKSDRNRKPRKQLETPPSSSESHDRRDSRRQDDRKDELVRKPPSGPRAHKQHDKLHDRHERHERHDKNDKHDKQHDEKHRKHKPLPERSNEPLPPMSDAAKAFAARLGMAGAPRKEPKPEKTKTLADRLGAVSIDEKPVPRQKYETPKQKKQRELNQLKHKQDEAKKLEEAKEKEEMLKFLDQLDSKDMDWAAYDD